MEKQMQEMPIPKGTEPPRYVSPTSLTWCFLPTAEVLTDRAMPELCRGQTKMRVP